APHTPRTARVSLHPSLLHTAQDRATRTTSRLHRSAVSLQCASRAARIEMHCCRSPASTPPPSRACTCPTRFECGQYRVCYRPPPQAYLPRREAAPEAACTTRESSVPSPAACPAPP